MSGAKPGRDPGNGISFIQHIYNIGRQADVLIVMVFPAEIQDEVRIHPLGIGDGT